MNNSADVCFISMPFTATTTPSFGICLLQGALREAGYTAHSYYANLEILKQGIITLDDHKDLLQQQYAEWLFAESAFREKRNDSMLYLLESCRHIQVDPTRIIPRLQEIKQSIPAFIDHVATEVLALKPKIVGATSMFYQHIASLAVLRRIKEKSPTTITLLGGANCDMPMGMGNHKNFDWIDYIVVGEADSLIIPFTELALEYGRDIPQDLVPPGVLAPVHRSCSYPTTNWRSIPKDLDSIPLPDYTDYFTALDSYDPEVKDKVILLTESSRGCWWAANKMGCKFCSLNTAQHTYRVKSPEVTLQQLHKLKEKYSFHGFEFTDNALPIKYFTTLLPRLAEEENSHPIFYEIRANNLTRERARLLRSAGIKSMQIGIEALNERLLQVINKGVHLWENIQALKFCACEEITIFWNLLFKIMGENDEDYFQTSQLAQKLLHIRAPTGFVVMQYHRYSPFSNEHKNLEPHWRYSYLYPLSPAAIDDITYQYIEKGGTSIFDSMNTNELDRQKYFKELNEIVRFWKYCSNIETQIILHGYTDNDQLRIVDTRPEFSSTNFAAAVNNIKPREYTFTGTEKDLLHTCDRAPLAEDIYREWGDSSREVIADFITKNLVIETEGRLVGLAMLDPIGVNQKLSACKTLFS